MCLFSRGSCVRVAAPRPPARADPFDRHDWVVERCGREVRYLIDFYQGRASAGHAVSVHIDARPAADTLSDAWDRVRMAVRAVVS